MSLRRYGLDRIQAAGGSVTVGPSGEITLAPAAGQSVVVTRDLEVQGSIALSGEDVTLGDDDDLSFGAAPDYWFVYDSANARFELNSTDKDGGGSDGVVWYVDDGSDDLNLLGSMLIAAGEKVVFGGDTNLYRDAANDLKTDDNFEVGGTLDVTGAGTFDSTLTSVGAATLDTGANGSSFGGDLTVNGDLGIGITPVADFHMQRSGGAAIFRYDQYRDSAFGVSWEARRARGSSGTPAVLQDGDNLLVIVAKGHDGTDFAASAAEIQIEVDGTPGTDDMPGRIVFSTTQDGAFAATEALRLDSSQNATFAGDVTVNGDLQMQLAEIYLNVNSNEGINFGTPGSPLGGIRRNSNGLSLDNSGGEVLVIESSSPDVTIPNGDLTVSGNTIFLNETANANMTTGLTINQGAADDEILALKSSDVAHGMTDLAETDTFSHWDKAVPSTGGVEWVGYSEDEIGIRFRGRATNDNTTKSTAADGYIVFNAEKKNGTTIGALGADANGVVFKFAGVGARYIFDVEGSAHADVEWTTFDSHDDLAVIEDMETLLAPSAVKRHFGEVVQHDREFFEREGLFHDIRSVGDGRMRGMMNQTRMLMLHSGAIRQVGGMAMDAQDRTTALESALREIVNKNPSLHGRDRALALLN